MKELNLRLVFPYNWYHYRKVKVYDNNGNLITKIMHCEEQSVLIEEKTEYLVVRLDYFKTKINVPKEEKLNLTLFLNFRDSFPIKYFDVLKRNCLTGKFVTTEEFQNFDVSFYNTSKNWIQKAKIDKPNLILGILISIGLIVMSIVEQANEYGDLVCLIGLISLISLIMIYNEKKQLLLFDYKSRMIATSIAFLLGILFMNSSFPINFVFLVFSFVFSLKLFKEIKSLSYAK